MQVIPKKEEESYTDSVKLTELESSSQLNVYHFEILKSMLNNLKDYCEGRIDKKIPYLESLSSKIKKRGCSESE